MFSNVPLELGLNMSGSSQNSRPGFPQGKGQVEDAVGALSACLSLSSVVQGRLRGRDSLVPSCMSAGHRSHARPWTLFSQPAPAECSIGLCHQGMIFPMQKPSPSVTWLRAGGWQNRAKFSSWARQTGSLANRDLSVRAHCRFQPVPKTLIFIHVSDLPTSLG